MKYSMRKSSDKLSKFVEDWQDERIQELQKLIDTMPRYKPQPGDPDYITPERVEEIQKRLKEYE